MTSSLHNYSERLVPIFVGDDSSERGTPLVESFVEDGVGMNVRMTTPPCSYFPSLDSVTSRKVSLDVTKPNNKRTDISPHMIPEDADDSQQRKRKMNFNEAATMQSSVKKKKISQIFEDEALSCSSTLHEACRRGPAFSVNQLDEVLQKDPGAALRPVTLVKSRKVFDPIACRMRNKVTREPYKYALNLAISYGVSEDVLECLMIEAPQVLSLTDNNDSSLHILLRYKPDNLATALRMLLLQPDLASRLDSHQNTVLHTAVWTGASLDMIRHIVTFNPAALWTCNFRGQTPHDVATQNCHLCSDEVADYLMGEMNSKFVADELILALDE